MDYINNNRNKTNRDEINIDNIKKNKINEHKKSIKKKNSLTAAKYMVFGFAIAILIGSLLLWLPVSSATGTAVPYIDALFTATTSLCVTGLVTVPTYCTWSLFGKVVILILIQLGGLGVITISTIVAIILGRRITLHTRKLVQDSYNLEHMSGMVLVVIKVVKGTFLVEGLGAVFYSFQFIPEFGPAKGIWYSIFHSVSAFCNAGIDIIGPDSLHRYVTAPWMNFVTMWIIVMGGLGFVVWWDLAKKARQVVKKEIWRHQFFQKLELHTKIVLVCTGILVFGGALLILLFEYTNPDTIGTMNFGEKVLASLFQSVTTRTAGFESIAQGDFRDGTSVIHMILMLIGGSPMGTAGGMKTTTIAVLLLTTAAYFKGKKHTEVFGRRLPEENIRTAIVVVATAVISLFVTILLMSAATNGGLLDISYEVVSALATVGLTRGFTPSMSAAGKIIIIFAMYLGRIGPVTLATAVTVRFREANVAMDKPEKRIIVG